MKNKLILSAFFLVFVLSINANAQGLTTIVEWKNKIVLIDAGPDTLIPGAIDTTNWITIGQYAAFSCWGRYQMVSGDSLGGTIKYELDIYQDGRPFPSSYSLSSAQSYWKMGESGPITIVTFTPALTDTGRKYFDLHVPSATAISPSSSIRFITENTTQDTFRITNRYMFIQP